VNEILVDSSVWIDFFRGKNFPETEALDYLLEENLVCTTGLIMAEIIPSAPTKSEFDKLRQYFQALPYLSEPDDMWNRIIDWRFRLKRSGVSGIQIADFIIAAIAKEHERAILTRDKHFGLIAPILKIKLLRTS
jgi:hypothetical protein